MGFVSGPLVKNPNTINLGLFHITDWYPTIVGLAGASMKNITVDGFDQWGAISGTGKSPRKVSYVIFIPENAAPV